MDVDKGKSQETKNIIWLTIWKISVILESSKKSMTDSYTIKPSVFEWLKIIEMKFVDDGMLLTMKITLTIWQHKNTSFLRANGGFIQISKVLILCHWGRDLISNRYCLFCNDCNKQEKNHTCLIIPASTNNGRYKVNFLHGWIGNVLCGRLVIQEVTKGGEPSMNWTERPVFCSIWKESSTKTFKNPICFVTVRSFATDDGREKREHLQWSVWRSQNTVWTTSPEGDYRIQKETLYLVLHLRGETEHDTNDKTTKIQSDYHTLDMSTCLVTLIVKSCSVCVRTFLSRTPHRVAQSFTCARHVMLITWWAYLFDFQSSIPFFFFIFSFILNILHFLMHFFHYLEGRSNPAHYAWKEMDSRDDSYLLTWQNRETFCRDNTSKDCFRSLNLYKEIHLEVKNWVNGYSDNNWIDETKYRAKPNSVWSNLKHLENMWA